MAFIHNFAQAFAMRFMLGIFESMFLPSLMYYLSRFYRKAEFGFRVGCFFLGAPLAGAFGGLLASGFLAAPGFGMVRRWRVIFFGEGLITMGLGVAAYFLLPDSPAKARFLTPEQRVLAVTRIKSENVGASSLIDGVDRQIIRSAMFNPTTLTMAGYFLLANLPVQGLGFFLPTILREIYPGESTISIQLRSVPPHFLGAVTLFAASLAGWLTNRRAIYMLIALPCLMTGYALFLGVNKGGVRYAATFLIAMGSVTTGPLCTTWATVNTTSDTARAATLSTVILGGNLGGLLATWTYIPRFNNAEPRKSQIPGNSLNLAGAITQWLLTLGLLLYMIRRNKQKKEGKDDWRLEGVKDSDAWKLGQKHPGFRFLY
ncbi:hypothetical protein Rhopal_003093-T1 [Rhodotorula paludigena]|uniref:Major facilitator superfamily (MFS) profile domain-containing protein n=1 Tax=Rhodotorula paludigena TaxID=86838 RepID=A0AAV5GLG5_9BASI|nr:hypothetical protein Rhopal_003093-T1 [Rhodotorula paludigena]